MSALEKPSDPIRVILARWQAAPEIADQIAYSHTSPVRAARYSPIPSDLSTDLVEILHNTGISQLYSHQVDAYRQVKSGRHVAVVTGTASGKTFCYNLPVIDSCIKIADARALYIFPTKALTQDQREKINLLIQPLPDERQMSCAIYDGDTPSSHRSTIRNQARIVLTNPDMLHTGVLPHHTLWANLFKNLRYVVIDEMHTYRGVFGSHLGNLLRRLQRIAAFYGSFPIFIFTSATIANPQELAEKLIEQPVKVIDQDGSPSGTRHFLLYNPPVVDPKLGIRASALAEGQRLISDLLTYGVQTIAFTQTRRAVEILLKYLRESMPGMASLIEGYRSGYLPNERRAIEKSLRNGTTRSVIATNALELGIDIGSIDASVIIGYPGSIASTRQQAGRAGRKTDASLAVLVASANPLDQYLVRHPDYLFEKTPELALIDLDNPLILLQHLQCASFELPFREGERFGNVDAELQNALLSVLAQRGEVHPSNGKYYWAADQYPAGGVSLRSTSPDSVKLQADLDGQPQIIGIVDRLSSYWMVHPNAVYLHSGQAYLVEDFDFDQGLVTLTRRDLDYYTEPRKRTAIEKLAENASLAQGQASRHFGDLRVTTQVTGYKKIRWFTRENLGEGNLDMPVSELVTTGLWFSFDEAAVSGLKALGLWNSDPNHYGPGWDRLRNLIRTRDHFTCQSCGAYEQGKAHHVHHKIPFRRFSNPEEANRPDNLVTLCPNCHQQAETSLRIRSGLAGLTYVLHHLAPLFLMCDTEDIGSAYEAQSSLADGQPVVILYDMAPAGIGLTRQLYNIAEQIMQEALSLVKHCECEDGCPSCIGPAGENGLGGKAEAIAMIDLLCKPVSGK